jgi:chromate reductase
MGAGGSAGTSRSQLALRQVLAFTESYVMPGPQLFLFHAAAQFDEHGDPTDDAIGDAVRAHLSALADWTRQVR